MTIDERIQGFAVTVQTRGEWSVSGPIWNAVGHCHRYLRFLRLVVERYETAKETYISHAERLKAMMKETATGTSGTKRQLTEEESKEFLAKWTLADSLYLEIESFYQFAKILLDRVADVVCLYFGHPRPGKGSSHTRLVERSVRPHLPDEVDRRSRAGPEPGGSPSPCCPAQDGGCRASRRPEVVAGDRLGCGPSSKD